MGETVIFKYMWVLFCFVCFLFSERQIYRVREKFSILYFTPQLVGMAAASLIKPGARSILLISYVGAGAKNLSYPVMLSQVIARSWIKVDHQTTAYTRCQSWKAKNYSGEQLHWPKNRVI